MENIVTVVVCPNCENEMTNIADTEFGKFFECNTCKTRVFAPIENTNECPVVCVK